jgi:small-conductance mechanosensitive channel
MMAHRIAALMFLIFLLLLSPVILYAQSTDDKNNNSDMLEHIWQAKTSELEKLITDCNELQKNGEALSQSLSKDINNTKIETNNLLSMYRAARAHPVEQLALLIYMRGTMLQLDNYMQPLQTIAGTINEHLLEIEKSNADILASFAEISETDKESMQAMEAGYLKRLAAANNKLSQVSNNINKLLNPGIALQQRLQTAIKEIESALLEVWKSYYLLASSYNLDILTTLPLLLERWYQGLAYRLTLTYPQNAAHWLYVGGNFLIAIAVMSLAGWLVLRWTRKLPHNWRNACVKIIKNSWRWIAIGFALLYASSNQLGARYFILIVMGLLFVIWGIISLSWQLRGVARPKLQTQPSPLIPFYGPAVCGVLLLFFDLPLNSLTVLWIIAMLIFMARNHIFNRKSKSKLPLLEHSAYVFASLTGIISLLTVLIGYARMSILLFIISFALVNVVILANALMALGSLISDRFFDKTSQPIKNALIRAFLFPSACCLALFCTLPWIWVIPGSTNIIEFFIQTDYTIGDASFDFSRLFLIVIVFFLFRSLISLGTTSLQHMADKLPHIEKGVIPPIQSLLRYGIWVLFVIIGLGLLGVDFTSLAVIAGGFSVGIGLGMQHLFNNLVSGLILIFGRTVLVGDYVEVGGVAGTVLAINIRSLVIETVDKAVVFIPNSTIMAGQFINWTRNHRQVRRTINVGVAYGSDVELVFKLLKEAAEKIPQVVDTPSPLITLTEFGDSTLDFSLLVVINDINNALTATTALRVEIERSFREHNVTIAFPQLDVHVFNSSNGG